MNAANKHVAVIGAGVAGLTAAEALAGWGIKVSLFEKTPFLGGHAIQLNCKATDACVRCGACLAEEKLRQVACHDRIDIFCGTRIETASDRSPYQIRYQVQSPLVNADRCNGCGICLPKCPVPGAILQGRAPRVGPYVAIRRDLCRYFDNAACSLCRDSCPQGAIHLTDATHTGMIEVDAVVLATGFEPYNPSAKPYGYGRFPNVITSLDAERLLRESSLIRRPSDGQPARRVAFFQCVGSRDARLGHSWCSKICCGSSMRMARLMQSRQTDLAISFFYIDVQTYGKDFQHAYAQARERISMVRAIPGEVRATATDELEVIFFDPQSGDSREERFDMVVLSVGLLPSADNQRLARAFDLRLDNSGWLPNAANRQQELPAGVFTVGSASGPMTIAQSINSAEQAVYALLGYLDATESSHGAA